MEGKIGGKNLEKNFEQERMRPVGCRFGGWGMSKGARQQTPAAFYRYKIRPPTPKRPRHFSRVRTLFIYIRMSSHVRQLDTHGKK